MKYFLNILNIIIVFFIISISGTSNAQAQYNADLSPSSITVQTDEIVPMIFTASSTVYLELQTYHAEYSYSPELNISSLSTNPASTTTEIDTRRNKIILEWSDIIWVQGLTLNASFDASSSTEGTFTITPSKIYFKKYGSGKSTNVPGNESVITVTAGATPPLPPSGLNAAPVSTTEIDISWTDNSGNEDGFYIERKEGSGGNYSQISDEAADVTSFSDSGLSAGTTYYYRVKAYNTAGESGYSNEASATTVGDLGTIYVRVDYPGYEGNWPGPVDYTLTGPETINGTLVPATHQDISTGIYTISYNSGGPVGAILTHIGPAETQTLTAGGSIGFTMYFIDPSPPSVFTNPATIVADDSATLNGGANPNTSDTTAYFEWGTDTSYGNTTSTQAIGNGYSNVNVSDNITGLSPGTTYHYRIVATNSNGTSYGGDVSFTTTGGPTGTIDVNATLDGGSWNGAVAYTLNGPETISGSTAPATFSNKLAGDYTLTYNSGGPSNAVLDSISPSPTQTLADGANVTYTMNFITQQYPSVPKNIYSISGDGFINIIWDNNPEPDISGYDVYRSTDNITFSVIGNTLSRNFYDSNVSDGETYYYKIKALVTSGDESEFSLMTIETYRDIIIKDYNYNGDNRRASDAAVGDIDGDGLLDLVFGYPEFTSNGANGVPGGKVDIYFGGSSDRKGLPDVTLAGDQELAWFGHSLAVADLNNDGYDDIIVGAPHQDAEMTWPFTGTADEAGRIYVFAGGTTVDPIPVYTRDGDQAYGCDLGCIYTISDNLGFSVSSAGDINGDGYEDVIYSAPYGGISRSGELYLLKGSTSFIGGGPSSYTGPITWEYLGYTLASAGDVNGDGYDDIIAGTDVGKAYLMYGGTSISRADFELIGWTKVNAGTDFNGDGYSDMAINSSSRANIYLGNPDVDFIYDTILELQPSDRIFNLGDINSDGHGDLIANGPKVFTGSGSGENIPDIFRSNYLAGQMLDVMAVGDADNDGKNDVIAMNNDKIYVYSLAPYLSLPDITLTSPMNNEYIESQQLTVSGSVNGSVTELFVSGQSVTVMPDNSFSAQITLAPGENIFEITGVTAAQGIVKRVVKVTQEGISTITIDINNPYDGYTVDHSPVTVSGMVNGITSAIWVNGHLATKNLTTFQGSAELTEGLNTITAVAMNDQGVTATDTISVNYLPSGTVSGTVSDITDGTPLQDVTVTVTDSSSTVHTVTTDQNGIYTIPYVSLGYFTSVFQNFDYHDATASGDVSEGQTFTLDIQMDPLTLHITSPVDNAVIDLPQVNVSGLVSSSCSNVMVNGVPATVTGNDFSATIPIDIGLNSVTAEATDQSSQTINDNITVYFTPPITVNITAPADGTTLGSSPVTIYGNVDNAAGTGGFFEVWAQSFIPQTSGDLNQIMLMLVKNGDPQNEVYLKITTVPGGIPIAVSSTVPEIFVSTRTPLLWTYFYFSSPPQVTAGNTYFIELWRNGRDPADFVDWWRVIDWSSDFYPEGRVYERSNGIWEERSPYLDTTFRVVINGNYDVVQDYWNADGLGLSLDGIDPYPVDVMVNGVQATVTDDNFSASVPLTEGPNTIAATAYDQYGHSSSDSINVSLISKGNISGTVTDVSTGLPVQSATVSVTDSLSNNFSAQTASDGTYTVGGLEPGTFNGSITKAGYVDYPFSGSVSVGQTVTVDASLTPAPPVISNITVSNISNDSATITWTTDTDADSLVDYGTTSLFGSSESDPVLTTSHSIALTGLAAGTTYHYMVTSANTNGSSSSGDNTFTTTSPITVTITSPINNDTINRADVLVSGTVTNSTGNETGVNVNGIVATVYNSEFSVNHVSLADGQNIITANATDTAGNTASHSILVNAVTSDPHVTLRANIDSGIAPLTVYFSVSTSIPDSVSSYEFDYEGDLVVDYTGSAFEDINITYSSEGIYYPTVTVTDDQSNTYSDTITIIVLNQTNLETLLETKWNTVKNALIIGDFTTALNNFVDGNKDRYNDLFNNLGTTELNTILSSFEAFELLSQSENMAECGLIRTESTGTFAYPVIFVKDETGIWKLFGL